MPTLVAVGGASGSGKSTLSMALAKRFEARVLRSDVVRVEVHAELEEKGQPRAERYSRAAMDAVYDEIFRRAAIGTGSDRLQVLDASFLPEHHRAQLDAFQQEHKVAVLRLWMELSLDARQARIEHRLQKPANDPSEATTELAARQESVSNAPAGWHKIDGSLALEDQIALALSLLRSLKS